MTNLELAERDYSKGTEYITLNSKGEEGAYSKKIQTSNGDLIQGGLLNIWNTKSDGYIYHHFSKKWATIIKKEQLTPEFQIF